MLHPPVEWELQKHQKIYARKRTLELLHFCHVRVLNQTNCLFFALHCLLFQIVGDPPQGRQQHSSARFRSAVATMSSRQGPSRRGLQQGQQSGPVDDPSRAALEPDLQPLPGQLPAQKLQLHAGQAQVVQIERQTCPAH